MLYFDTSFLVPLILPEATSDSIAAFDRGLSTEQLTVSHWTRVEFSSPIAREVRMGGLDVQTAARADARFEAMVGESFCRTPTISIWQSDISAGSKPGCELETRSTWPLPTIIVRR